MRRLTTAFFAVLLAVAPAWAFDTPEALLQAIYARYSDTKFDWDKFDPAADRSKGLNDLFAKDAAATAPDDVGRIDFDPYIDAQDYQLSDVQIGAPKVTSDHATADVSFTNFDESETLTYTLVQEADGWKVDDIEAHRSGDPWSLRALLTAPAAQ